MADYWVSNERHYCDYCKTWLSGDKASISFHEKGKKHQINVSKRITDITRRGAQAEKESQQEQAALRKMEEAAMNAYARDMHCGGDITARNVNDYLRTYAGSVKVSHAKDDGATAGSSSSRSCTQVDPLRLQGDSDEEDERRVHIAKVAPEAVPDASTWVEAKSPEGHTYYWNVKTNESVWTAPKEGFLSHAEYQRITSLAEKQYELQQAEDAKRYTESAEEQMARYNRECMKYYRRPAEIEAQKQVEVKRQQYKTEDEAKTAEIGKWETVATKVPETPIDWELPTNHYKYEVPQVVSAIPREPPAKRFKERTIDSLPIEQTLKVPATFKKRKIAQNRNARKPLDD